MNSRTTSALRRAGILLLATLSCSSAFAAASKGATEGLPPRFQSELTELYSKGQCSEILSRVTPRKVKLLRPNVMAIVASCDPPWQSAEEIFELAEHLVPTGDLILVLHAKYRTKKNPKSAEELWRRLLLIARNQAFIDMAHDYFSGRYEGLDKPINLNSSTYFASLSVGGGMESNPRPKDFVYLPTHGSDAEYTKADVSWRHWTPWGSVAADVDFSADQYFAEPAFNYQDFNFKIPIAVHVASAKDIIFQPIGGYSRFGGQTYRSYYGLGVLGVVYRDGYRQSVQGLIYQDLISIPALADQDGAHYRFEYSWEFFPDVRTVAFRVGIEHVSSGISTLFNQQTGIFPWSHTDVDASFKYEQNLHSFSAGVEPAFAYRVDSGSSQFVSQSTGQTISVRRSEWDLSARPYLSVPLLPEVQLIAYYSYDRVFSNLGADAYVNRNQTDHIGGLALKASLSSY